MRNASPPRAKRGPAFPPLVRTVLSICLACSVFYLAAVYLGPELPRLIAGLQGRLALSQYVGS
jgi:hypothetical protein